VDSSPLQRAARATPPRHVDDRSRKLRRAVWSAGAELMLAISVFVYLWIVSSKLRTMLASAEKAANSAGDKGSSVDVVVRDHCSASCGCI
jgi:hypothetical protein